MEYKEPKKRVTKNDKKNSRDVYSTKHVRNLLKQKIHYIIIKHLKWKIIVKKFRKDLLD